MDWTLPNMALVTGAIYIIHGVLLAPAAMRALRTADEQRVGLWSAIVTMIEASKLVWLLLTLSALLTWGAIALAGHIFADTASAAAGAVNRLRQLRNVIVTFEATGSLLLLTLAFAALLFWIWQLRIRRAAGVIEQIREVKAQELLKKLEEGTLPALEPNERMTQIARFIGALTSKLEEIEAAIASTALELEQMQLKEQHTFLTKMLDDNIQEYISEDLRRRINVSALEAMEGDIPRPPRSFWERFRRLLISRGLLGGLAWGQRILLVLNLLLAIPTVLVAAQPDIAQRLSSAELRAQDLRIDWTAREQADRLAASMKDKTDQPQPLDAEATQAADQIARVFERSLGEAFSPPPFAPSELSPSKRRQGIPSPGAQAVLPDAEILKARSDMRAAKARHDVLAAFAQGAGGQIYVDPDPLRPIAPAPGEKPGPAQRAQKTPGAADSALNAASALGVDERKPVTSAGRLMAQQLRVAMSVSPAIREAMVGVSASLGEAPRPSQVANLLLGEIFSGAVHMAPSEILVPEMQDWIAKSISEATGNRVNAALSNTFRATLFETRDITKAMAALGHVAGFTLATSDFSTLRPTVVASLPNDSEFAELNRSRQPGFRQAVNAQLAAAQRDLTKSVIKDALELSTMHPEHAKKLDKAASRVGATQAFEDIVPPTSGGGGGGGGGAPPNGNAARPPSKVSITRSRSFAMLRGFHRVGGVLIGRDPEAGGPSFDIREFSWERDGDLLRFRLRSADGSIIEAGPFHPSVVHAALAYAADGRVLTVTMISAEPLRDLKILLHPALLDTPLGCRAISIDRFADEATASGRYPDRERARLEFEADVILYKIARANLISNILPHISNVHKNEKEELNKEINDTQSIINEFKQLKPDKRNLLSNAFIERINISDPNKKSDSVVHRSDHFSSHVTRLVELCRGPNVTPAEFVACVAERGDTMLSAQSPSLRDEIAHSAIMPVPAYQKWTVVQETPFTLDIAPSFITRPSDDSLRFLYQAAFTSPAYQKHLLQPQISMEIEDGITDPYEFRHLKITEKVREMIASDPEKRDVLKSMVEFTALQRLFRLGFYGRLGPSFPIERFAELAGATSKDVKRQATPRWKPNATPELSFLSMVVSGLPQMSESLKAKAEACLQKNGITVPELPLDDEGRRSIINDRKRQQLLGTQDWASECVFEDSLLPPAPFERDPKIVELIKRSQTLPAVRDLRRSLGIEAPEHSDPEACQPL